MYVPQTCSISATFSETANVTLKELFEQNKKGEVFESYKL
jgi:hypothetical protein